MDIRDGPATLALLHHPPLTAVWRPPGPFPLDSDLLVGQSQVELEGNQQEIPVPRWPSSERDTASSVLDVAERLVQVRGYNGFSYADVAAELQLSKAALHYHFAGKAELGEALLSATRSVSPPPSRPSMPRSQMRPGSWPLTPICTST